MSSEPGLFLDGETSVRPIEDLGEVRFLERISQVSFFVLFCSILFVTRELTYSLQMKNG